MRFFEQWVAWVAMFFGGVWALFISFLSIPSFLIHMPTGHLMYRLFGMGWCRIMGIRVVFEGLQNVPKHGAVIIASNHESMFDILVLAHLKIDYKWISKIEVRKVPILGWAMRAMGCYFVRRDHKSKDLNVMRDVENGLRNGISVAIFPEGTRSLTGDLLPFKKGAFRLSQNTGTPLLPIAIIGTRNIASKKNLPTKRRHQVILRIGEPMIVPKDVPLEESMARFRSLLTSLRSF